MSAGAAILIALACVVLLPVVVPFVFLLCLVFGTERRDPRVCRLPRRRAQRVPRLPV